MINNLTLLIPAKFESESLPIFLEELKDYNYKKLVVLDANDTKTIQSISKFNEVEILHQKKNGYGNALIEGINHINTELFCIINADGSMNPNELDGMLNEIYSNNQDIVFGYLHPREKSMKEPAVAIHTLINLDFNKDEVRVKYQEGQHQNMYAHTHINVTPEIRQRVISELQEDEDLKEFWDACREYVQIDLDALKKNQSKFLKT